ncbi:MAG TPA: hypothetical protein VL282_12265 [Tepidisphaeraceae bacterium]|jgi:hypothetical protein|nr:hypothetical protein [Tepidisphaeraceae bacterium]
MRYAPYVAIVLVVAVLWAFSASNAQVHGNDSGSSTVSGSSSVSGGAAPPDSTAMRAMVAEAAGYPRIGSDVEIGLIPNAAVPAPFNNAQRKARGKLLAFDANWVGIQAREYDVKIWLPRENVGYVADIPGTGNH